MPQRVNTSDAAIASAPSALQRSWPRRRQRSSGRSIAASRSPSSLAPILVPSRPSRTSRFNVGLATISAACLPSFVPRNSSCVHAPSSAFASALQPLAPKSSSVSASVWSWPTKGASSSMGSALASSPGWRASASDSSLASPPEPSSADTLALASESAPTPARSSDRSSLRAAIASARLGVTQTPASPKCSSGPSRCDRSSASMSLGAGWNMKSSASRRSRGKSGPSISRASSPGSWSESLTDVHEVRARSSMPAPSCRPSAWLAKPREKPTRVRSL